MKSNFKIPRIRSRRHLDFLRSLPCIRCSAKPSQAAHVRTAYNSGTGLKPGDNEALPLCAGCHNTQHMVGQRSFFGDVNRALELCNALWFASGDKEKALQYIVHYRK